MQFSGICESTTSSQTCVCDMSVGSIIADTIMYRYPKIAVYFLEG